MAKSVSWNLRLEVSEGRLDDARSLMSEMVESARGENGALLYEWFLAGDGAECHINERYTDSGAALAHLDTFGERFADRFLACFQITSLAVYGDLSEPLRETLSGFGAAFLAPLGGFAR